MYLLYVFWILKSIFRIWRYLSDYLVRKISDYNLCIYRYTIGFGITLFTWKAFRCNLHIFLESFSSIISENFTICFERYWKAGWYTLLYYFIEFCFIAILAKIILINFLIFYFWNVFGYFWWSLTSFYYQNRWLYAIFQQIFNMKNPSAIHWIFK